MSRPKVLITRRWPRAAESAMAEEFDVTLNEQDIPMSEAELAAAMTEFDALCPCVTDNINAAILKTESARVRIIANYGVGHDHIDLDAAREAGVTVTNTPEVLTDSTANLAMTLLLMLTRRAGEGEREVRQGKWRSWYPTYMMGVDVAGKILGIIGMGRIGLSLASKAHHAFDMQIIYHGRKEVAAADALQAEYCEELEDLLQRADFVSLHCPSTPETVNLINAERLAMMKPSAWLINTARGDIVDEDALIAALEDKRIAGAGLDVYAEEPHVPEALLALENVVLLPHLGSATLETRNAMGLRVLENLKAYFSEKEPPDQLV